jgi:DNA mismatch repair protein MutS
LPAEGLVRAREILRNLETLEVDEAGHAALARGSRRREAARADQLGLFAAPDPRIERLRTELRELALDSLTPLEALNLLAAMKRRLE